MNTNRGSKPRFNTAAYEANVAALPELCFDKSPGDDSLVVLKRGERGYYPADADKYPLAPGESRADQVRRFNNKLGVTTAQRMAMFMGSMAGFDSPGASPKSHDLRAFVEDLRAADQRLGDEAGQMMRDGATFEEVRGRFANIFNEAHAARVGFPTLNAAKAKADELNATLVAEERAFTIYEARRSKTTAGFYVAKLVEGSVEEAIYDFPAEQAA